MSDIWVLISDGKRKSCGWGYRGGVLGFRFFG